MGLNKNHRQFRCLPELIILGVGLLIYFFWMMSRNTTYNSCLAEAQLQYPVIGHKCVNNVVDVPFCRDNEDINSGQRSAAVKECARKFGK